VITVTKGIIIPEDEITYQAIQSSGPGGQNVNKVATAIQLRFDVSGSQTLPDKVRERLFKLAGKRINREGFLILEAHNYRTQEENRKDALNRLIKLIQSASIEPKRRIKTRPSLKSRQERLQQKRLKSIIKRYRSRISDDEA
jgi:ribosome-associated protein